jgi:LysM repeat protein
MKIIKILGIAAGLHALALILLLSSPGCSNSKAAQSDTSPITAAPAADASSPSQAGIVLAPAPDSVGIRYSPTRPGTTVATALESKPVTDVTPATTYSVASGDSLSSIAKKNHLTKSDLAAANNLRLTSVLHVGQKLIIPSKAGQAPAAPAAAAAAVPAKNAEPATAGQAQADSTKHVVRAGETLGGIARKYGVKQGDIAVANNITDPRKIQPGQELIIPGKGAAPVAKQAKAPASKSEAPAEEDLDAGLKPPSAAEVPVVKIDDASAPAQPKNP